ncbi:type II toxin-antitoxin system RelE/ParE family toxin [Nanoarchaeota archaeon]
MVDVDNSILFEKKIRKIKNFSLKDQVKNQIRKIVKNPKLGKPMKYDRKGTREIYIGSFRLSYAYLDEEDKIIFLDLYHKDEQ